MMGQIILYGMGAVLILMVALMIGNARRKARRETPNHDLRYEFYAEPLDDISEEFKDALGDFAPPEGKGVLMVRLSFSNRGKAPVARTDFTKPIVIVYPSFTQVIEAAFSEFRGARPDTTSVAAPRVNGNSIEIDPLDIPANGAVVFNIALRGSPEPEGVYGPLAGRDRILRLGEASADDTPIDRTAQQR